MRYTDIIIEATNCTQKEAEEIENIMRDDIFHSTLDLQTRKQLEDASIFSKMLLKHYKEVGLIS